MADNKNKQIDINTLIPDVYRSEIGKNLNDIAVNPHLAGDNSVRSAGTIGNPHSAYRITEPSPHRQAHQLAPVIYNEIGSVTTAMSFAAFMDRLALAGVDVSNMDTWGATQHFNWAPPINIDKIINFRDYFWQRSTTASRAQYITIENRAVAAASRSSIYTKLSTKYSGSIPGGILSIRTHTITIDASDVRDAFVTGDVILLTAQADSSVRNGFWTVASAVRTDTSTIVSLQESIIDFSSATPPTGSRVVDGVIWRNTTTDELLQLVQGVWTVMDDTIAVTVDLATIQQIYQAKATVVSGAETEGVPTAPWDNSAMANLIWTLGFLEKATNPTQGGWVQINNDPSPQDLWHDTNSDTLRQFDLSSMSFLPVVYHLSRIIDKVGRTLFAQAHTATNNWTRQNAWVHKTDLPTFNGVTRAQLPIIEYDATVEMNQWTKRVRTWKYRATPSSTFVAESTSPTRFELEPVKDYVAVEDAGVWSIYLFASTLTTARDLNIASVFVPGYRFVIEDQLSNTAAYTVATSRYLSIPTSLPTEVLEALGTYSSGGDVTRACTLITLVESTFTSPLRGNTSANATIHPLTTSKGDAWQGYHAHWVMSDDITIEPSDNRSWHFFGQADRINPPDARVQIAGNANFAGFEPQVSFGQFGATYQTIYINNYGHTRVDFGPRLRYSSVSANCFVLPNSSDLRVYVNGVQQQGNYTEIIATGIVAETAVGFSMLPARTIQYVAGVVFDDALQPYDVVRIETFPAALDDMGQHCVPVRTVEDEVAFTLAVAAGEQPAYMSMSQYISTVQLKTQVNQYPAFNTYDAVTNEFVGVSSVITFDEDSSSPINANIQRRISVGSSGTDYALKQHLTKDSGALLSYRNTLNAHGYWYNPTTNTIVFWDGQRWASTFTNAYANGLELMSAVVSTTAPTNVDVYGVWYNPTTSVVSEWNPRESRWIINHDITVSTIDPSLSMLWRGGNAQLSPTYVDQYGSPIDKGSILGSWGIPTQWTHNISHENRSTIRLSGLVEHYTDIAAAQADIPLMLAGAYNTLQSELRYDTGGAIKEYSSGYDTLVSAMSVSSTTPVGVMEFAQYEYETQQQRVINTVRVSLINLLTTVRPTTTPATFQGIITDQVMRSFATNDLSTTNYIDSTAYNPETGKGIKGWIATLPMIGLATPIRPVLHKFGTAFELLCHDGHRMTVVPDTTVNDRIARSVCSVVDQRRSGRTFGRVTTGTLPSTYAQMVAAYGVVMPVLYQYTTGVTGVLSVFNPYSISAVEPDLTSQSIPDGTQYYNTTTSTTYVKTGPVWMAVGDVGSGSISTLWEVCNVTAITADVLLYVEQQLFARSVELSADQYNFTPNESAPSYHKFSEEQFTKYVNAHRISVPLLNTSYSQTNAFTWNYGFSTATEFPSNKNVAVTGIASWQELYDRWYHTPYPHLEPWRLQGYISKPTWWDTDYADDTGTRMWKIGMWTNVLAGSVPIHRPYPNGTISTGGVYNDDGVRMPVYTYIPVNMTDVVLGGVYAMDDILPPYFDTSLSHLAFPGVRSLFTDYAQIVSPYADYVFGSVGPTEWRWKSSSQYGYDRAILSFRVNPISFLLQTFGSAPIDVNGIPIDRFTGKIPSHADVVFHGSVKDGVVQQSHGINQWYVMYNRFNNLDTQSAFFTEWANWEPRLAYCTAGIVDASTINVLSTVAELVDDDSSLVLVNSGIVSDVNVDAFNVSVIKSPPHLIQYNVQADWILSISPLSSNTTTLTYFGPKVVPVLADKVTNTFTAFAANISSIDNSTHRVFITGNGLEFITVGDVLSISNQLVTVKALLYSPSTNITQIEVSLPVSDTAAKSIINTSRTLPWVTGDMVVISSTKFVPGPMFPDVAYFIIRLSDNSLQLAETSQDAHSASFIDLTTIGTGVITIAELSASFKIMGGSGSTADVWYHYALDYSNLRTVPLPYTFSGMQSLINVINGYEAYQKSQGIGVGGVHGVEFDPVSGRTVTWAHETERFIDWAYSLRAIHARSVDTYPVSIDNTTNLLTLTGMDPMWIDGTKVRVLATDTLPAPLISDMTYFIRNGATSGTVYLATSSVYGTIDIVDILGTPAGGFSLQLFTDDKSYPAFELNPGRNHLWIDTPMGVLSDITKFPTGTQRGVPTIYDQYNRPLDANAIAVYRGDTQAHITTRRSIPNDVDPFATNYDEYIHLGGARLYIEGYEHFLIFSDYALSGDLIYDPFLGLAIPELNIELLKGAEYNLKPVLGGYYMKNGNFSRNIEGSLSDLRASYDSVTLPKLPNIAKYAHKLIGYEPDQTSFLQGVAPTDSTHLQFYKGMIGAKGTVAAIDAYSNIKTLDNVSVDEYWAWKVAEFGDVRVKTNPEVRVLATDEYADDIKMRFLARSESASDTDAVIASARGFTAISWNDNARWVDAPKQRSTTNPLFLESSIVGSMSVFVGPLPPLGTVDMWINTHHATAVVVTASVEHNTITINGTDDESLFESGSVCEVVGVGTYHIVDTYVDGVNTVISVTPSLVDATYAGATAIIHNRTMWKRSSNGEWTVPVSLYASQTHAYINHGQPADDMRALYHVPTVMTKTFSGSVDNPSTPAVENVSEYYFVTPTTIVVQGDQRQYIGSTVSFAQYTINEGTYRVHDMIGVTPRTGVTYNTTTDQTIITLTAAVAHPVVNGPMTTQYLSADQYSATSEPATVRTVNSSVSKVSFDVVGTVIICPVVPNYDSLSPARILDRKSRQVVERVPMWDPARDRHDIHTIGQITTKLPYDPINYQRSLIDTSYGVNWQTVGAVGMLWWDTSTVGYRPYYDASVFASPVDRLQHWGALADWASIDVYEWVESTVAPQQWDASVASNASDSSMFQQQKLTGTPRKSLFRRERSRQLIGEVDVSSGRFVVDHPPVAGAAVVFGLGTTGSELPAGLESGTTYYTHAVNSTSFALVDVTSTPVEITDVGSGQLYVMPIFTSTDWVRQHTIHESVPAVNIVYATASLVNRAAVVTYPYAVPTNTLVWASSVSEWNASTTVPDQVNVYVNGVEVGVDSSLVISDGLCRVTLDSDISLFEHDMVTFVRIRHEITDAETAFDPINDDGSVLVDWKEDYEYNTRVTNDGDLRTSSGDATKYYFWISNTTKINTIEASLKSTTMPYMVVQSPKDNPVQAELYGFGTSPYGSSFSSGELADSLVGVSVLYRDVVLRRISDYVSDGGDYSIQFTHDDTLRDHIDSDVKNDKHTEWQLIRRGQSSRIPEELWTRLVESIVGYKLADPTTRVPSLEYELYDATYATAIRYGLGDNQTFVDGVTAKATIAAYLLDSTHDFGALDVHTLLTANNMDTVDGALNIMNAIWTKADISHVNGIWFSVLHDALVTQPKYDTLLKTSWISLHCGSSLAINGGAV